MAATVHPQGCPVAAMRRQVAHHQHHSAISEKPLSSYKKGTKWQNIQGYDIRAAIRAVVQAAGPSIGFTEAGISARSLRAGGGMDLLVAWAEPDTIRLVGMWRSNTMFRYLHTTEKSFTEGLKPATSAKCHSRDLKGPSTRGLWRPEAG